MITVNISTVPFVGAPSLGAAQGLSVVAGSVAPVWERRVAPAVGLLECRALPAAVRTRTAVADFGTRTTITDPPRGVPG